MLTDLAQLPLWSNLVLFLLATIGIWRAGAVLTALADVVAERTAIGEVFAGVLLLGVATSLPEIATTGTASAADNPTLAGTNLLGGVAMQLIVLALADAIVLRGRALTFFSPTPVLLLQGVLLVILIAVAVAAVAATEILSYAQVGLWSILLGTFYFAALFILYRYEGQPRWQPAGEIAQPPQSATDLKDANALRFAGTSIRRINLLFALSAAGVLISGYLVAVSGAEIAEQSGLGETLIGATLVAFATSLPEISTTFTAVRLGAYSMAVGNILGTNALEIALFLPADLLYRQGLIFDVLDSKAAYLGALAVVCTCVYLWGMLERRDKTVFGMGVDSAIVLVLYASGMSVFYAIHQ